MVESLGDEKVGKKADDLVDVKVVEMDMIEVAEKVALSEKRLGNKVVEPRVADLVA